MKTLKTALSVAISAAIVSSGTAWAQASNSVPTEVKTATNRVAGSLSGRVINDATGNLLPAAQIKVKELGREIASGRDGHFVLNNLAAGDYTLIVSYDGLDMQEVPVTISGNSVSRVDIRMKSSLFAGERIMVVGRAEGYASTINIQRDADSLRTVVSADALGQIREGNIGDALVRLPGMSVETRAGVQRTATIRGLAPQYNTVTVDGIRMTNVDGNRDIALDSFPANLLARVDVIKAPTADLSADAIGGTVDLVTRSAFDKDGRTFEAQVGTTFNDNRDSWNKQLGVTYGDTFGAEHEFGLLGSVYYFRDERGYDVVDTGYTVNAQDQYQINRALYYDRKETKDKVGAGLMFDYRPDDDTSAFIKALYHYDYRWLWRRGTDYRPTDRRVDSLVFYREPKNVFEMYIAGAEHRMSDVLLDGRIAYSRAKKDYPVTLQVINSMNDVDLTADRTDKYFPTFTTSATTDLTDPSNLSFRQYQSNQVPRVEDEWSYDSNISKDFYSDDVDWTIKAGVRVTLKDAAQAQPDTVRYTGLANTDLQSLLENYNNPDFMSESGNRNHLLNFFPDWRKYLALHQNNNGELTQSAAARFYTESTIANADFSISEDIYAAYLMASVKIGQLDIVSGLRHETTKVQSEANEVVFTGTTIDAINRISGESEYNNLLPSLHLKYTVEDSPLLFRGSVSKAISRPPPGDLVASRQENSQLNQRIIGNPNLKPAESVNYDISAEYFMPPLGILSLGVFYKDIDNFVFSTSRIAADGVDERTRTNGDGGKVKGLEFAWAQQFSFLPGAWRGLSIETNYTYLDTEGAYPNRDADQLELVNSPRYIFNAILSYAYDATSVRLSMNKLPDRLEAVGARTALDRYNQSNTVWDLAMKYEFSKAHHLFFNIKNLTNEPTVQYQGSPNNPTSVVYYGTQYNLGVNLVF